MSSFRPWIWSSKAWSLRWSVLFPALLGALSLPGPAATQVTWQDLVFTGGVSAEGYRGNLTAVTVPAVDSTDEASAAVGEMAVRGGLSLFSGQGRAANLQFDAGLRQFVSLGFRVRDYAPREWVAVVGLDYQQRIPSVGVFSVETRVDGRRVDDRPPMPLFIQPGYLTLDGRARVQFNPWRGISVDATLGGEWADYQTAELTPQLDLLDRREFGLEMGGTWGNTRTVRLHSALRLAGYRNQGTFDPDDPNRKDRSFTIGATGTLPHSSGYFVQLGVEGTVNRSNSDRPEYNALRVQAVLAAPFPYGVSLNLFGVLTVKDYLLRTDYARLVPGEEADNASQIFVELARPLLTNLDGALRFGWTRAETDIGDSYFRRYGASFLLRYRPWAR